MRTPLVFDHVTNAVDSLRTTRTRTLLTMLGVVIGIASITAILSLAGGITQIVGKQVDALGGNLLVVRPGKATPASDLSAITTPVSVQTYSTSTLGEADYELAAKVPGVEAAAPLMTISGTLRTAENSVTGATVVATTPEFIDTSPLPIREGQFIDSATNMQTAVIGSKLAIDLFGTDMAIGHTFKLRGQTFTVIGQLKKVDDPVNYNSVDYDNAAFISLAAGKSFHNGMEQIQQINVKVTSANDLPAVSKQVSEHITNRHNGEDDFTIVTGQDIAKPTSELFRAITGVMTAIAAISLVVGGVGIMNIMLVGVAERTREIGLRKAVGASSMNIVGQFMTESLIISFLGGIFGLFFGFVAAFIICTFFNFTPLVSWEIAAIAFGTAMVVGGLFGLYPAIKAARKDPIESLRQYH